MNLQTVEQILFWCMVMNLGLMIFAFVMVTGFRPMVLKIHSALFRVPEEHVSKALYDFHSLYKLMTFFFVIIPWIALRIVA